MPSRIQSIFPLCIRKLSGKKNGLTPWENFDSLDFSFLFKISKNNLYRLIPPKHKDEKSSIFWQKQWTNLFGKFGFLDFKTSLLKLHFSGLKNVVIYPDFPKTICSGLICPKNTGAKKFEFLTKSVDLRPWKYFDFLDFFKDSLFRSKTCALYPDHPKTTFSGLICPLQNLIKSSNFCCTNPLGKLSLFVLLLKLHFSGLKIVLFLSKKSQNDLFWLDLPKRHSWYINSLYFWQKPAIASFSLTQLPRQNNKRKK